MVCIAVNTNKTLSNHCCFLVTKTLEIERTFWRTIRDIVLFTRDKEVFLLTKSKHKGHRSLSFRDNGGDGTDDCSDAESGSSTAQQQYKSLCAEAFIQVSCFAFRDETEAYEQVLSASFSDKSEDTRPVQVSGITIKGCSR